MADLRARWVIVIVRRGIGMGPDESGDLVTGVG